MRIPHPPDRVRWSPVVTLAVVALLGGACGAEQQASDEPTTTTSSAPATTITTATTATTAAAEPMETCEASNYRISYPADWSTNDPARVGPCRFFHPEPFVVPVATEALELAVSVGVEAIAYDQAQDSLGPPAARVRSTEDVTVAGRPAVRALVEATGEALLPEGVLSYQYFVDLGDETMVATTMDISAAGTFESNRDVLDEMMATVEFKECSAEGAEISDQDGLPGVVAEMRRDIAAAAAECDYDRLEELATEGTGNFTFSFGASGDASEYWRAAEAEGDMPLAFLAGMLDRPYAERDAGGDRQFTWPSAFGYDDWGEVPQEDREALRPLYGDEAFESFADFGSYAGYRVGVTAAGDWVFFVAGD